MLRSAKRGPIKAVQLSIPGSDVVSAVPPQKPTFNLSKRIAKPLIFDPKLKGDYVPLKCNQFNSYVEGTMQFNAPELLIDRKLSVPKVRATGISYDLITREDVDIPFTNGLDYAKGIRPSAGPRALAVQMPIPEPVGSSLPPPVGSYAPPPKVQKTTYSVGALALAQLSQ